MPGGTGGINVIEITPTTGTTATATWEALNGSPVAIDTFNFGVYVSYAARAVKIGTAHVRLRYGPEGNSSTDTEPRFFEIPPAEDVIHIGLCPL